jgi:hypothetical protein
MCWTSKLGCRSLRKPHLLNGLCTTDMKTTGTILYVLAPIALFQVTSAQYLGQQCFTNNACLDNSKCSSGYCGGLFATCTEQSVGTDCRSGCKQFVSRLKILAADIFSVAFGSDRCLKGQCSDLEPATLGNACYTDQQCPGLSTCSPSELVCGGQDAMCKAEDGTGDGASSDCASGCRFFVRISMLSFTLALPSELLTGIRFLTNRSVSLVVLHKTKAPGAW